MSQCCKADLPWLGGRDAWIATAIFLVALVCFLRSPLTQLGDSKYTLLLSHSLLTRGSFALDGYGVPHDPNVTKGAINTPGNAYQTEFVRGHLYYYFPPGSSILSTPFVLVADGLGYSMVRANGTYKVSHEDRLEWIAASVLMAVLAVVFYGTARCQLPPGWSAGVALGGVLGTQIWSTASRTLWTHTWGALLLGGAVYLLLAAETGRRRLPPVLLASVLSWTYFVRPTNSVFIVGITVYVLLFHRAGFLRYAITGAAWFLGFVAYSWFHFRHMLPSYYQANRLEFTTFWEALAGNLISPSRGLLVFVPVTLFVFYLLVRYWRRLELRRLAVLALAVSAGHLLAVSCFVPWFGGTCYGPRYTTELVPWLVLLAVLGLAAAQARQMGAAMPPSTSGWRIALVCGAVLLLLSVGINARGANSPVVLRWNRVPESVETRQERLWDWRYPQFLAGLVDQPPSANFPVLHYGERITFGQDGNPAFLLNGWSGLEATGCWSDNNRSRLGFVVKQPAAARLRIGFSTYLYRPRLRSQRILIDLNGQAIASYTGNEPAERAYTVDLPAGLLRERNVLTFHFPDATTPASVGQNTDLRLLGIYLRWLEIERTDILPAP